MAPPETLGFKEAIAEFLVNTFGELYESKLGAISFTVITTSKVVEPPELVAVTVYDAVLEITVGVPEILPVEVLKASPVGKLGVIL